MTTLTINPILPPITICLSAQCHSVNRAFATKQEAIDFTDWDSTAEYGDGDSFHTGHIYSITFKGVDAIGELDAWIDVSKGNIELYSCMGTTILNLPSRIKARLLNI